MNIQDVQAAMIAPGIPLKSSPGVPPETLGMAFDRIDGEVKELQEATAMVSEAMDLPPRPVSGGSESASAHPDESIVDSLNRRISGLALRISEANHVLRAATSQIQRLR